MSPTFFRQYGNVTSHVHNKLSVREQSPLNTKQMTQAICLDQQLSKPSKKTMTVFCFFMPLSFLPVSQFQDLHCKLVQHLDYSSNQFFSFHFCVSSIIAVLSYGIQFAQAFPLPLSNRRSVCPASGIKKQVFIRVKQRLKTIILYLLIFIWLTLASAYQIGEQVNELVSYSLTQPFWSLLLSGAFG